MLHLLAGALIIVGLLGTVLPVLPGLPLMFAGMVLAAWNDGFRYIGGWTLGVLGVLLVISVAVDVFASIVGARKVGASNKALWGAGIGGLVGLLFGLPGLLLGPFLGAVGGELMHGRDHQLALKVGVGTWVGLAIGAALKLALAVSMLGVFGLALLVD